MRILFALIAFHLLTGCVGPSPPPAPAYAPRVVNATRVSFQALFPPAELGSVIDLAASDLGWQKLGSSAVEQPERVYFFAGDRFLCFWLTEDGGSAVTLVAETRMATDLLEARAGALAKALVEH